MLAGLVLCVGCGDDEPDFGADWVAIDYRGGNRCVLTDWGFEYSEAYTPPTKIDGIRVTIPISARYDKTQDSVMRVYSPGGEQLVFERNQLERLRFEASCSGTSCRVEQATLMAGGRYVTFTPVGPRNNQRAIMPMADHYFPDHYSGSFRDFRGVGIKIVGTPAPGACDGVPFLSLSTLSHSADRFPEQVEFHAP
jgi:hypothetical protein